MYCSKCGNEVQEGSAFCGKCGAKVGDAGVGSAPVSTAAQASAAVAQKKSKIPLIAGIAIAIVAVVVIVLVCLNVFGGSGIEVKGSTEAYTWEELSKISAEIAEASDEVAAVDTAKKYNLTTVDGKLDGTQTKSVALSNGTQTAVQIAGFAHDDKSDGSGKAGITFIFMDCIGKHVMNSTDTNAGGWEKSEMRSYLNSDGLNLLPQDLRDVVVGVDKLTNNTGETDSASSVTKTSDKLWLFSFVELEGNVSASDYDGEYGYFADIFNSEGSEYKLYADAGVNPFYSNEVLVKDYEGSPSYWWERSPLPALTNGFLTVESDGSAYNSKTGNVVASYGVVPGFCI